MPDEVDGEVLKQFVHGDPDAFESLFRQFEAEVYRWVLRIVRDAGGAEDVVVEAFWRAFRARAQFDPSRSFGAWMRRIATNAALDYIKAAHRRARWNTTDDRMPAPAPRDSSLNDAITRAFDRLPPKLRVVALLALIDEQPYAEIADALALPLGTVKSRVFRAVENLKKELARVGVRP